PPDMRIVPRVLTAPAKVNIGVQRLADDESLPHDTSRFRLYNDSPLETLSVELAWQGDKSPTQQVARRVQVPPQRAHVVTLTQPIGVDQLRLSGDAESFDNVAFVSPVQPRQVVVRLLGATDDDPATLYYYLQRASLGVGATEVIIEPLALTDATSLSPQETPLVICTRPMDEGEGRLLRSYAQKGGRVFVVLDPNEAQWDRRVVAGAGDDDSATTDVAGAPAAGLAALLDLRNVTLETRRHEPYAMLGEIDLRHALLVPFQDPKFADFTKIRVWQSYKLTADHEQPWQSLMRYDDGTPCWVEQGVDQGKIWILTTGWRPETSQLALSTKFVPLLAGLLRETSARLEASRPMLVGDPIQFAPQPAPRAVIDPAGKTHVMASDDEAFAATDLPGLYTLARDAGPEIVAVNLAPEESRLQPIDPQELEKLGIQLGKHETASELELRERQLKDFELESRQQGWRWLIFAALAILLAETWVAGRTSRREQLIEST
ncbi:MAG: hypothetical protein KDB23_22760, partial [Planctomycetales bacterium]|nr:hypothetical protein [Planctomycetales bacterium]